MIQNIQIKDEKQNQNLSSIVLFFARKLAFFNSYKGTEFIPGFYFAFVCMFFFYFHLIALTLYVVNFEGFIVSFTVPIIKIFSVSEFLIDKPFVIKIFISIISAMITFNILVKILIMTNQEIYNILILSIQMIDHISFWITYPISIHFLFNTFFIDRILNANSTITTNNFEMIYKILSLYNIIISVISNIIFIYISGKFEHKQKTTNYFSRVDSYFEIILFLFTTIISLLYCLRKYSFLDIDANIYITIILLVQLSHTAFYLKYSHYNNYSMNTLLIYCKICSIYTSIICYVLVNVDFNEKDIAIFFAYIMLIKISGRLNFFHYKYYIKNRVCVTNIDIERYFSMLTEVNNGVDTIELGHMLTGSFFIHSQTCDLIQCPCNLKNGENLYIPLTQESYSIDNNKYLSKIFILSLIKGFYEYFINKEKRNCINLRLMFSNFLTSYIGNNFQAIYNLTTITNFDEASIQQIVSKNRLTDEINSKLLYNFNLIEESFDNRKLFLFKTIQPKKNLLILKRL